VQELVPLIGSAPVDTAVREKWLDRLFKAIQEHDPPYIESLGDHWGDLCATPELASNWADQLLPTRGSVLRERRRGTYALFSETIPCYSALFKAGRHEELLELLSMDPHPIWQYLVWGRARPRRRGNRLRARPRGKHHQLRNHRTFFCRGGAAQGGRRAEAFDQFALLAHQAYSNLSTFRALAKKYPELAPHKLLIGRTEPLSPWARAAAGSRADTRGSKASDQDA
jgi:hypothetical protein